VKPRVTSTDVAKHAGVSQSTVSFVLSGRSNVSEGVRKKVFDAVRVLGYVPLKPKKRKPRESGRTIGILLDLNPFLPFVWNFERPILYHIEKNLYEEGNNTVVIPISFTFSDDKLFEKIMSQNVDALISMLFVNENVFDRLNGMNIPIIVIMNDALQTRFHAVLVDDYQGLFDGTTYLIQMGHRNLVYLDYERPDMPSLILDRFFGFTKAVEHHNLTFPERHHVTTATTRIDELMERLQPIFREKDPPTGIIALDDYIAASLMTALRNLHLRVPEDVSIISIGDVLDYTQPYIPAITTIQINNVLAGKMAAELLLEVMSKGVRTPQILKITPRIVERGTCRRLTGRSF
jgi:LacI family transcriptional regulator